ncbi:unnamed protein product, partial [Amoebophrya sp. A120]
VEGVDGVAPRRATLSASQVEDAKLVRVCLEEVSRNFMREHKRDYGNKYYQTNKFRHPRPWRSPNAKELLAGTNYFATADSPEPEAGDGTK